MGRAALIIPDVVERSPDLVHRVRGLRYFSRHLAEGVSAIAGRQGIAATVDRIETARVFIDWVEDLTAQKSWAAVDRRDYTIFGAGLLMSRLVASPAIRVPESRPAAQALVNPLLDTWPKGYLATAYCTTVLDAVLRQENLAPIELHPAAGDERVWSSFRENCDEDPHRAIAFLDLFVGNEPNWTLPTLAAGRPAMAGTAH